jgi:DNA-binding HxlR family transcriptional regulator
MAHSKANYFPNPLFSQATWCRIQAHPARIIILTHLCENGPSRFMDFKYKVMLARPTISQHVRILVRDGVINITEKYPKAIYEINSTICSTLAKLLLELQNNISAELQSGSKKE